MNTRFLFAILAVGILASCNTYHFSERQPVDRQDLARFPKPLIGTWKMEGSKDLSLIVFESNRMEFLGGETIFNGITDTVYHGKKNSLKTRVWSRANKRMDTITNYIVHGKKVYAVESDHLTLGFPFTQVGDSLVVGGKVTFTLGDGLSLRKVNDTLYVFHVKTTSAKQELEGNGPWWVLVLIEIREGRFYLSYLKDLFREDPGLIESFNDDYYFDIQWTAKDILKLRDSIFEKRDKPFLVKVDGK